MGVLVACGTPGSIAPSAGTSGGEVTSSGTPVDASGDDADDEDGPHRRNRLFIVEPDGGSAFRPCDPFSQDCPTGEKCGAITSNDSYGATRCVPIVPGPSDVGEPCFAYGEYGSGFDTCRRGALCWNVDRDTHEGECVEFCQGSEANPFCTRPDDQCQGRDFMICIPTCCPLEQDCHEGEACYPVNDNFSCAPDASGELGAFADPCAFINVCDPGLFCANPEIVPGCTSEGCCSAFCDTRVPDACTSFHPDQQCVPWFDPGHAPPGEEHVGACVLPR